jgi:hypothetical protein
VEGLRFEGVLAEADGHGARRFVLDPGSGRYARPTGGGIGADVARSASGLVLLGQLLQESWHSPGSEVVVPHPVRVIGMRAIWSYIPRTFCSNSAAASGSMVFLAAARCSLTTPSTISTLARPRMERARAWSGVSPASMASATSE